MVIEREGDRVILNEIRKELPGRQFAHTVAITGDVAEILTIRD
jgi:hypothetical protein